MISGLYTILAMLSFASIAYWAFSRNNRQRFEDAARLPLNDEVPAPRAATREPKAGGEGQ